MSPIEEVLDPLRTRAYYADRVGWEVVTRKALAIGGTLREAIEPTFAALAITTSVEVDRSGRRYESAIEPDVPADDPLSRAREWLGGV